MPKLSVNYQPRQRKVPEHALAHGPGRAAEAIDVSPSEIYNRMASGELPARKLGKRTLILAEDLRAFVHSLPPYKTSHEPDQAA